MCKTPSSQRKLRQRTRSGSLTLSSPISRTLNDKLTRRPVQVVQHDRSLPNSKPSTVSLRDARQTSRINARERAPAPAAVVQEVIDLADSPIVAPVVVNLADIMQEAAGEDAFDEALCMTPERPACTPSTGSEPVQNLWSYSSDVGVDLFPRRMRY